VSSTSPAPYKHKRPYAEVHAWALDRSLFQAFRTEVSRILIGTWRPSPFLGSLGGDAGSGISPICPDPAPRR